MATNENIRVVQLTDDNDNPVSPVVNVGSLYDKNGNKVDNLLSYKLAGTNVPVPEIKNVQDELTAKVDAKLAELDAAVTKLEKAAESGAKVTFTAKVKAGETVEKYMPVAVKNGECYCAVNQVKPSVFDLEYGAIAELDTTHFLCYEAGSNGTIDYYVKKINLPKSTEILTTNHTSHTLSGKSSSTTTQSSVIQMTPGVFYSFVVNYVNTSTPATYVFKIDSRESADAPTIECVATSTAIRNIQSVHKQNDTDIIVTYGNDTASTNIVDIYRFNTTTNKFLKLSGSLNYSARNYIQPIPISDTAFYCVSDVKVLASSSNSKSHSIYDIVNDSVSARGSGLIFTSASYVGGVIDTATGYLILMSRTESNSLVRLHALDCSGTNPVSMATLTIQTEPSGTYQGGDGCIVKNNDTIYVAYRDYQNKTVNISTVAYAGGTISLSNTAVIADGIDITTNQNGIYRMYVSGNKFACILYADAHLYGSANAYVFTRHTYGCYTETTDQGQSDALALASGAEGDVIDIGYSGVFKGLDIRTEQQIDTRKFAAEVPVDGTLVITRTSGEYGGQTEIVSYVGNGKYGADNPCKLKFAFKPKIVKLIGIASADGFGGEKWSSVDSTNYANELMIDIVGSDYSNNLGFYMRSNGSSKSYCKFDTGTNTLYWYNTSSPNSQMNISESTYYFLAIK